MKSRRLLIIIFVLLIIAGLFILGLTLKGQYRIDKTENRQQQQEKIQGIVCIGDSLTHGTGGENIAYPYFLESQMMKDGYYIPVYNCGVGGENVSTITGRMGNRPYKVKAFIIPEDEEKVEIEFIQDEIHKIEPLKKDPETCRVNPVVIAGVAGTISYDADENKYYFSRECDLEALNDRQRELIEEFNENQESQSHEIIKEDEVQEVEIPSGSELLLYGQDAYTDGIYIVFMGENAGYKDIEDLIDYQHSILDKQLKNKDKYLIIGLTTGSRSDRAELEEAMMAEYGQHYINIREYFSDESIVEKAAKYGISFSEEDLKEMSEGYVPECLRDDGIHYNEAGYRLLADKVYQKIQELGYLDDVKPLADKYNRIWGLANKLEIRMNGR